MKKTLSMLLVLTLVLSLFVGCGSPAEKSPTQPPAAQSPTEAAPPPTTEPPTEPTLSPEEVLYNSLTDRQKQVVDLGIVPLEVFEDMDRIATVTEAAQWVQNARTLMYGTESEMMNAAQESDQKDLPLTRFWLAQAMYLSEIERWDAPNQEDYYSNIAYLTWGPVHVEELKNDQADGRMVSENGEGDYFNKWHDPDAVLSHGYLIGSDVDAFTWSKEERMADTIARGQAKGPLEWPEGVFYTRGSRNIIDLTFWYDRITGEKLLPMDEDYRLGPADEVPVKEAAELILRYYNYKTPEPEMTPYDQMPTYDKTILPDELLSKETDLPEPTNQQLPSSWRGLTVADLLSELEDNNAKLDWKVYEYEIQAIKDAGFNYIQLVLDFRFYHAESPDYIYGFAHDKPKAGSLNETHLKQLDQVIAWCIERDIHVNLACTKFQGWPETGSPPPSVFGQKKYAAPLAEQWALFAKRYQGIPNTYLSFTLFREPDIRQEKHYDDFFTPVVEAIREADPDRVMIADVTNKYSGKGMAQLGVALSTRAVVDDRFNINPTLPRAARDKIFAETTWPYEYRGVLVDSEQMMTTKNYKFTPPDAVAATAAEYGVGFMVSSWAPRFEWGNQVSRERFSDEMMEAFLSDMTATLEERGYGWCYGDWFGFAGLGAHYPALSTTTYTQIEGTPLLIDDKTFAWFQEMNGVQ